MKSGAQADGGPVPSRGPNVGKSRSGRWISPSRSRLGGVRDLGLEPLRVVLDRRRRGRLELAGRYGKPGGRQALHPEKPLFAGLVLVAHAAARESLAQARLLVAPLALLTDGPAPTGGPARGGGAQGEGGHDDGPGSGVRGAGVAGQGGENAQQAERSHGSQSNASSFVVLDARPDGPQGLPRLAAEPDGQGALVRHRPFRVALARDLAAFGEDALVILHATSHDQQRRKVVGRAPQVVAVVAADHRQSGGSKQLQRGGFAVVLREHRGALARLDLNRAPRHRVAQLFPPEHVREVLGKGAVLLVLQR